MNDWRWSLFFGGSESVEVQYFERPLDEVDFVDEFVLLWKETAYRELHLSDCSSHFLEIVVVAPYVALKTPFRKFLPEESFEPCRQQGHRQVEFSYCQNLNFFDHNLYFLEVVIEDKDEIAKGRRVDLIVFGCCVRTGQHYKIWVLSILQNTPPWLSLD